MKRTLLMVHEKGGAVRRPFYMAGLMCDFWQKEGWEILEVEGLSRWPEADAVFLHVDLSSVPLAYAAQSARFRLRLNDKALNIEKRSYCGDLLKAGESFEGPVIVKTNLNGAGLPESRHTGFNSWAPVRFLRRFPAGRKIVRSLSPAKADYRIYRNTASVPGSVWKDPKWIVQKCCSERLGDDYVLREYYFMGDREYVRTEAGASPVFTQGRLVGEVYGEAHPALRALRRRLGLDFGKIDFVMHGGAPFVFDANKTVGISPPVSPAAKALSLYLAGGLSLIPSS